MAKRVDRKLSSFRTPPHTDDHAGALTAEKCPFDEVSVHVGWYELGDSPTRLPSQGGASSSYVRHVAIRLDHNNNATWKAKNSFITMHGVREST